MSIRKPEQAKGATVLSDVGELPGYFVDEYRDLVNLARRKLDRLDAFSADELESWANGSGGEVDWEAKRSRAIRALDRWSDDASAIVRVLRKLVRRVEDGRNILTLRALENSITKEVTARRSAVKGRAKKPLMRQ